MIIVSNHLVRSNGPDEAWELIHTTNCPVYWYRLVNGVWQWFYVCSVECDLAATGFEPPFDIPDEPGLYTISWPVGGNGAAIVEKVAP